MHNSKKWIAALLTVVIIIGIFLGLDFLLYPCTFVRNDIHAVTGDTTYQDIYLGTSHGKINIDPASTESVNGRSAFNLCVGGEYTADSYHLLKLLIEKGKKPERVIYEVSYGYLVQEKEEGNNYLLFYHELPFSKTKLEYFKNLMAKCNFRTWLFPWYEYPLSYELGHLNETISRKFHRDYSVEALKTDLQEYHENGFIERYAVDTSKLTFDNVFEFHAENLKEQNMDYLDKFIELCKDNDIELVAINTPLPGYTLQQFEAGYEEYHQYFSDYFVAYDVRFINFNHAPYFNCFSHKIEHYTDFDGHMNGESAREFSKVLANVLEQPESFFLEAASKEAISKTEKPEITSETPEVEAPEIIQEAPGVVEEKPEVTVEEPEVEIPEVTVEEPEIIVEKPEV